MIIALYLRLSMADGDTGEDGKDESNSIENQRTILMDYISHKGWDSHHVCEYVDDGFSGTNFERPAFKRMIKDMKRGQIDILLTKDLSRLGRNYIEVGDYMDQIFPILGVRYIAVNSRYDSNDYYGKTSGMDMSLMNLVNSLYSRDLSKKYRSSVQTKWKNGHSTSGRPTFGYLRHPKEKGEWIIDPEAAAIVRHIFDLALEGKRTKEIANILNMNGVMTPGQYREKSGHMKRVNRKVKEKEWLWDIPKVLKVLKSYEYTGALVQSKTSRIAVGSKSMRKSSKNERYVFENHHEPIVAHYEFLKAGTVIQSKKKRVPARKDQYPLAGKIYCGNCGLKMVHPIKKTKSYVLCKHKATSGIQSACCNKKYDTDYIDKIVLDLLLLHLNQLDLKLKEKKLEFPDYTRKMKSHQSRLKTLEAEKLNLYETYAMGLLDKETYFERRKVIVDQIEMLKQKQSVASDKNGKAVSLRKELDLISNTAMELINNGKITNEIADIFIDKITIFDEEHIEVVFTFEDYIQRAMEVIERNKASDFEYDYDKFAEVYYNEYWKKNPEDTAFTWDHSERTWT